MTASLLTPAQSSAIASLPLLSARVFSCLLLALYAEPGFSDVEAKDLVKMLDDETTNAQVKGALASLVQKGLVNVDETVINGKKVTFIFSQLHSDDDGVNGDARRDEGLAMVTNRIRVAKMEADGVIPVSPEPVTVAGPVVGSDLDTLTDLAMIAIFGRKAGLSWERITAAMGEKVSFCLRLRPIMKAIDASAVRASYQR